MTTEKLTRSEEISADITALLRARNPLLWIVTREEGRAETHIFEAALAAGYVPRTWDVAQGAADMDGKRLQIGSPDPGAMLDAIREASGRADAGRGAWIMRDLPAWLSGPAMAPTNRALRNLARSLPGVPTALAQAIIVLTPSAEVPPELQGHATLVEWPLPDREEIAEMLSLAIEGAVAKLPELANLKNGAREAAIDAAVGLSGEEASACYARSLVQLGTIDPVTIAKEKRRVIARERVLEWFDPLPGGLDSVGGLDVLKDWLNARKSAYSPQARAYGLPAPKGALLVGLPGCGKSLTAKAVATAWGVPLLRFDIGALKSKYVGESEGNLRKAFRVIEAIGRCVVWLDEIEKALQGATSGSADGGVSTDALGAILSWMQERSGEAFVIATANDVSSLPPELMRKGRFDEIFFVDAPNSSERVSVLSAALRAHKRELPPKALAEVAAACEDFTGSEIAALVPDALFASFADGARELTAGDLLQAARSVVPLTKTAGEKIKALRDWAATRARSATSVQVSEPAAARKRIRSLDI